MRFIGGWLLPSPRSERAGLEGIYKSVPRMMEPGVRFGQDEKWAGKKLMGIENRLSYSVVGLRTWTAFGSTVVLHNAAGNQRSQCRRKGMEWGSETSLMFPALL